MTQRHIILFNPAFSSNTKNVLVESELDFVNNYYVYSQTIGGGVVDEFNVFNYLDNPQNSAITNDFVAFLTGSTTQDELVEILSSGKKLAEVFNGFYNNSVISGSTTPSSIIDEQLIFTSASTKINYNFNWDGLSPVNYMTGTTSNINDSTRILTADTYLETYSIGENYYIPIFIKKHFNEISRIDFSEFVKDCIVKFTNEQGREETKRYVQCFVDLNIQKDPYAFWNNTPPKKSIILPDLNPIFIGNPTPLAPTGLLSPFSGDTIILPPPIKQTTSQTVGNSGTATSTLGNSSTVDPSLSAGSSGTLGSTK